MASLYFKHQDNEIWFSNEKVDIDWTPWTIPSDAEISQAKNRYVHVYGEENDTKVTIFGTSLYLFAGCTGISRPDLFVTDDVTNMGGIFENSTISSIDLSTWNISNVTSMQNMFKNCSNLTEIIVDKFDTSKVNNGRDMFLNCTSLVGGNGTTYSSSNTGLDYAKIDSSKSPGYFTSKYNWEEFEPWVKENGVWIKYETYM